MPDYIVLVSECKALWGERSSICVLQCQEVDCTDEGLSNKTSHEALPLYVGALTFSCKDAESPSTQSWHRCQAAIVFCLNSGIV